MYTTLDINLQRDAAEAVRAGMKEVDEILRKRTKKGQQPKEAQVALVAMDPQTGAIKALIGGRDYGLSQLNRAVAKRQPGSVFKPFVYAAALNSGVAGAMQTRHSRNHAGRRAHYVPLRRQDISAGQLR